MTSAYLLPLVIIAVGALSLLVAIFFPFPKIENRQ